MGMQIALIDPIEKSQYIAPLCMQPICLTIKSCFSGCWCPIPEAEEEPKKKPEEPCCCPCCCPCCPTPCCHQCCHHIHHHHHHCCPCCHCCHCCHCCPCCCHCCHCKRSQGPLSPSLLRRPVYLYMVTPSPCFSGPYNGHEFSLVRGGPLRVH